MVCEQPAVDGRSVAAVTGNKKVPYVLQLEPSPLRLLPLHSGSSPALPYLLSARGRSIFGKYLNVHLKFTVYGRKHVNTLPQCSPASVGLAQARPN